MTRLELSKWKDETMEAGEARGYVFPSPARRKYFTQYVPLHKAALRGDWEAAKRLLDEDHNLVRDQITQGGETALHIATIEGHFSFVDNLLQKMSESDMEIRNNSGNTALCFAATAGHLHIVELMVRKNRRLPSISGHKGITPLYMAALQGHKDLAEYLFDLSGFESWSIEDQIALLTTCVDSGLYNLAVNIVRENETLVVTQDINGETPLEVLAQKPSAFCRSSQKGWWDRIANTIMKLKNGPKKAAQCDAHKLFEFLWGKMICQPDVEAGQVNRHISKLLFMAADSGNDQFLVGLIRQYPDSLYERNDFKHSIFHIAVLHRYVRVFNLIYELRGVKDLITTYIDNDGNNILHLAAKLAPQSQLNCIPGQALQMQREVLWYKEIEKIVQPTQRNMKNLDDQTPYDLFLSEHKNLMKEGEKVMKQTAKSCMLVAMLIATVVYTTAFTVPGGYNNNTGVPILQNEKLFMVFPISEAVATLSSLTSMLMFLSILTSRYTEMDFLNSLPFWLVIGVAALFVSIVAMMVTFCSCLLLYQHGLVARIILLVSFACIPIMFILLKYPLLVTILRCSYGDRWLFRSNN